MEFIKQVLPRLESPQSPGCVLSAPPPPAEVDASLELNVLGRLLELTTVEVTADAAAAGGGELFLLAAAAAGGGELFLLPAPSALLF